ncbi:MAG TPA: peptide-methionine (S)-S-oxide reductase MsrA [Mycobacteriales bacterium]|jgi:peptide-methionine (S)-S-oxide reductase|nr:peptide-methionine (S)-S-oxide reductase MsrA [Mycobacteriales bacterium]
MIFGRSSGSFPTADTRHTVLGTPLTGPWPANLETAVFGMGCFWGAEQIFWQLSGVYSTSVGYSGGRREHPSYEQVCSGATGHAEVVQVIFDPAVISFGELLKAFWENHDPTQGNRQGNDVGAQYRSVIYTTSSEQLKTAQESKAPFQLILARGGYGGITTEIGPLPNFFLAEEYHQQYLQKNPGGYCPIHATGLTCPVGVVKAEDLASEHQNLNSTL